ncbi:hypothetical protein [Streptacidiphilus anmyonensis]|uniref:hypothetical protein n=1 Tax=Streptacidiphilus anmyonensis TaxID=405782 RepID=UPI0005A7067B|nr:hypothetical protein [Streptacidiphilus anmyonensis]
MDIEDTDPEKVVELLRLPWTPLLEEVAQNLHGWITRHVQQTSAEDSWAEITAEIHPQSLELREVCAALAQAAEYSSTWPIDGVPEVEEFEMWRIYLPLSDASDVLWQCVTTAESDLEPVPRSTAAHALLACSVMLLRTARSAYDWAHRNDPTTRPSAALPGGRLPAR